MRPGEDYFGREIARKRKTDLENSLLKCKKGNTGEKQNSA